VNGDIRREWFDKDFYATLGVPKNASPSEIKKAYRKLAQKHHPDANAGNKESEERFKEISSAYDVLGDEEKRKQYDQVREMAASGYVGDFSRGPGRTGAAGGGRVRYENVDFSGGGFGDIGDLGDLFSMFGGGGGGVGTRGRRRTSVRGADLEAGVSISFDEAMSGTTVPVRITGPARCDTCGGSGAAPGTSPTTCPQCAGTGSVSVNQGPFSIAQSCPRCGGRGQIIEHSCPTCGGSGTVQKTRMFSVRIPPGVKDGARIRVKGRGEPGPQGSPPGDLYVVVHVAPHPLFGRKGSDLTLDLPVSYPEAALGANVRVPTLNGPVTLKVPSGTQPGRTFRIRGKGAPKKGGRGDMLVTVNVPVPKRVSREEKDLLKRLREAEGESPRKRLGVEP
jgi:molecular chaperone DnaJ